MKSKTADDLMTDALAEVVDCIMMWGEYPQPPHHKPLLYRAEFDLCDWADRHLDAWTRTAWAINYAINQQIDDAGEQQTRAEEQLTKMLSDFLRDSQIVRDHAAKMAADIAEDSLTGETK